MHKYKLALLSVSKLDNYLMCLENGGALNFFKGDANGQKLNKDGASDA